MAALLPQVQTAVNRAWSPADAQALADGDELALLPPVAGGAAPPPHRRCSRRRRWRWATVIAAVEGGERGRGW